MITALNNRVASCELKPTTFLLVTLSTGTAVQASATSIRFTAAKFYGFKTLSATAAPTANTSTAYAGYVDTTGASGVAAAAPAFVDTITAGSSVTKGGTTPGTCYDLSQIYFLGATGDKILVAYET